MRQRGGGGEQTGLTERGWRQTEGMTEKRERETVRGPKRGSLEGVRLLSERVEPIPV